MTHEETLFTSDTSSGREEPTTCFVDRAIAAAREVTVATALQQTARIAALEAENRSLLVQLDEVRMRCKHTRQISSAVVHTENFRGELKLACEILRMLEPRP